MVDKRFHSIAGFYKISDIAKAIDCELPSDFDDIVIHAVNAIEQANSGEISFLDNKKYFKALKTTKASACIVPQDFPIELNNHILLLKTNQPYFAYKKLVDMFYRSAKTYSAKIMSSAYISESATIGQNCYIGHNVVIEDHVVIGDNCIIEAGSFIDFGVQIGNRAKIYSNVSISYAEIGEDVVILPGARIGQDGFGFATEAGIHHKIYHTGKVIIGNNVEIGANTTIDRGSMNNTVIEDLCRIDNLVQIAHNVQIGRGSIIVAQAGIAGSSKMGQYCALGGQVGVAGHIVIGNRVQVAAQGGVIKNIDDGYIMGGTPAVPIRDWHKQSIIMRKLINR